MNERMINRLQVLVALGGFGLGLITIYVPTWLFLRHIPGLRRAAFLEIHPQKRRLLTGYEIAAFLNLLAAPLLSIPFIYNSTPWIQPFLFFCFISNSIGILNGIFECLTGICPKRGINYRYSYKQNYVYQPGVRKIGLVRLLLGIFFIGASLILFRNVPL